MIAASERRTRHAWAAEMVHRVRFRLVLKTLGISAFMWAFFAAYFHLLRHPVRPVFVMPLTGLDHAIPFQPGAFWAYVSLWVYVGIVPGLMLSLRDVVIYGLWIGGLCLTGLALFYLLPTAVPPPQLPADLALTHPAFAVLQGVDAAGNACPSLHVATAAFTAVWVHRLMAATGAPAWVMAANVLWLALIVHSTIATRQHVVLDAVAGLLLALLFVLPSLRWRPASLQAAAR